MPLDDSWLASAALTGLVMFCAVHALASRLLRLPTPYHPLRLGFLCGAGTTVAASWLGLARLHAGPGDALALMGLNLFAFLGFSFGYFGFVNLNLTSLRIRILAELLECGGEMPLSKLAAEYGMEHVAAIRLQRLVSSGNLVELDGRIYNGKRLLLFVARVIHALQICILGRCFPP